MIIRIRTHLRTNEAQIWEKNKNIEVGQKLPGSY